MKRPFDLLPLLLLPVLLFLFSINSGFAQRSQIDQPPKAIFDKGKELWQNKKYNAARQQFEKYREIGESEILKSEALFYEAKCAMELYQRPTLHLFQKYIQENPEMTRVPKAYFNMGKYNFRKKEFPSSTKWFNEVNIDQLNPAMTNEYHFMAGYALYKQEHYDTAQKHFAEIMKTQNAYYNMGNYYYAYIAYMDGLYAEAIPRFKRIQNDEKFGPVVPVYITQNYLLIGKNDSTIAYGQKALSKQEVGKKAEIKAYVGQAYYHKGNYDQVIEYLEPLNSSKFELKKEQHLQLGMAYYQKAKYPKAIRHLKKPAINEDSVGQYLSYHLGDAYLQTGEREQARNLFDFASNLDFNPSIKRQAHFNYAKLSYDLGYQQEAIQELKAFTDQYPKSKETEEAQSLLGDILLTTENYQNALTIIEAVPEKTGEIMAAYQKIAYQRGLELYEDQNYKEARDIFIKSLKHNYDNRFEALAYLWLGECYFKTDEFEKAIREYKNFLYQDAAEATPYYHLAHYNIGYAHFKLENYEKAVASLSQYIKHENTQEQSDRYLDAASRLGDCHFGLKQYDEALTQYDKVIATGKQDIDYALYQKGIIKGLKEQPEEKIEALRQLSQEHPESPYIDDALYEIGNVYFLQSNYELAKQQFRYLIQDYQNSAYYRAAKLKLGLIHFNQKSDQKAIRTFKGIVKEHPYSNEAKEAINQLQTIYIDQGKADSLINFLESIPNANLTGSFKDSATYEAAFSHIKNNNCQKAIKAFEDYLESFPQGFFALKANYYIANCARRNNLTDKALKHYDSVIAIGSNQYMEEALKEAATIYYNKGHCKKALPLFKKLQNSASERNSNLRALLGRMRCYFKLDSNEATVKFAKQLLQLSFANQEHHTEARFYLGKSYHNLEEKGKAIDHLRKVHEKNGGEKGAESLYIIASIHFDWGNYEKSRNSIYQLKEEYTNYNFWVAKGFILLADVFVEEKDFFQAKHTLQSIVKNYQGEDLKQEAREKLEAIKEKQEARKKDTVQDQTMEPDTLKQLNDE